MYHPTTRVLAVLELLQTHGRMSGAELATRLAVDARTLRRYIVVLEEIGIPITTERGRHGGYALMAGFKLPPMMFTDDEALALSVGLLAARSLGLAEAAPAVASAQAKLERIMPDNLKRRVRAIDETVRLDLVRAVAPSANNVLLTLSTAAQAQQRVHMHYRDNNGEETQRNFDAFGLAFRKGCWYVVGMCHLRQGMRSFRLDRVTAVQPIAAAFERPANFDALAHLKISLASIPRAHAIEVILFTDLMSAQAHFFAPQGVFEQTEQGVLMRSQSDHMDWFARMLAGLPFGFRVVSPPALLDAVRTVANGLLAMVD